MAFPKKSKDAVQSHVYLTLLMFDLTNAYRTQQGQSLAERGIRRQRLTWQDANKVFVIAGECYAIFDLEELFILMGCEPQRCWRVDPDQVRRDYHLAALPKAA